MILINPLEITDTRLLSSSVPEPDISVGEIEWVAASHALGARRIKSSTHSVYEVVADPSTTDDPEAGVLKTPQTWVRVGPTNRYKMFDEENNTGTVGEDVTVVISPTDETVDSIAGFGIECSEIVITSFDNAGNQTDTTSIEMKSRGGDANWYDWFYAGFVTKSKFVYLDLPTIGRGSVKVEYLGAAKVGTFTTGAKYDVGSAQHGTNAELLDYSTSTEDGFGNIQYSQGFTAKLINYDILSDTVDVDGIFNVFNSIGKSPTVFMGNKTGADDMTLVYGVVRGFNPAYTGFTKSRIALTVRGLI